MVKPLVFLAGKAAVKGISKASKYLKNKKSASEKKSTKPKKTNSDDVVDTLPGNFFKEDKEKLQRYVQSMHKKGKPKSEMMDFLDDQIFRYMSAKNLRNNADISKYYKNAQKIVSQELKKLNK